ncbi:hypothetical protein L914_17831 [Phytophthora nicotianae]|uniref:Uncharacterized protein n=2 Tax=Phytophthora nicotianae TaxID=4792 RepID=W2MG02_PHYNI|nr:hypothetical protein L914_17831 [Phytophthora nicotianae]
MANYELQMFPTDIFDFATYQDDSNPAGLRGQAQRAFAELSVNKPELHEQFAFVNLGRFPANEVLLESNPFLPAINNVNKVDADDNQALKDAERRKQNFLKLHAAHFGYVGLRAFRDSNGNDAGGLENIRESVDKGGVGSGATA